MSHLSWLRRNVERPWQEIVFEALSYDYDIGIGEISKRISDEFGYSPSYDDIVRFVQKQKAAMEREKELRRNGFRFSS